MLHQNCTIKSISLCRNGVDDKGGAQAPFQQQRSAASNSNVLSSSELQALAAALCVNNAVTEINLSANQIGNAGAEA